jgi:hypothetical protein
MVLKYFQDKQIQAQRAEKSEEQRMRKIASIIAKEIKNFWGDVHKVMLKKVDINSWLTKQLVSVG